MCELLWIRWFKQKWQSHGLLLHNNWEMTTNPVSDSSRDDKLNGAKPQITPLSLSQSHPYAITVIALTITPLSLSRSLNIRCSLPTRVTQNPMSILQTQSMADRFHAPIWPLSHSLGATLLFLCLLLNLRGGVWRPVQGFRTKKNAYIDI